MTMKSTLHRMFIVLIALVMATVACNLTSEAPPTLAPRQPQSSLTPSDPLGPNATIGIPPTNQPLPSGVTAGNDLGSNQIAADLQLVDSNRMFSSIQRLITFDQRHALAPISSSNGSYAASEWLRAELEAIQNANPNTLIYTYNQDFQFSFSGQQYPGRNIFMVINGTDTRAGVILLGAHYDTVGSDPNIYNSFQPGANDNGSGVAAALEIARIMAARPHKATIVIAFFAAEELNRYGSRAMAQDFFRQQNIPLRAVVNLDQMGNPDGNNGEYFPNDMRVYSATPNTSQSRQLARFTNVVSQVYMGSNMRVNVMGTLDRTNRWGDHQSFSDICYPSVRFIEQQDNSAFVHNSRDNIDRIDRNYLQLTTQTTLAVMMTLADGPLAPELRTIDRNSWTLQWSPVDGASGYVVAVRRPNALQYEQLFLIQNNTSMAWESFQNYEAVAVAAVDQFGQMGEFSREQLITVPEGENSPSNDPCS